MTKANRKRKFSHKIVKLGNWYPHWLPYVHQIQGQGKYNRTVPKPRILFQNKKTWVPDQCEVIPPHKYLLECVYYDRPRTFQTLNDNLGTLLSPHFDPVRKSPTKVHKHCTLQWASADITDLAVGCDSRSPATGRCIEAWRVRPTLSMDAVKSSVRGQSIHREFFH